MGFFIHDPWGFYSDRGFSNLMDDAFIWAEVFWNWAWGFIQPVVSPKCPRILYLLSWKSTLKILLPSQTRKKLFFNSETGNLFGRVLFTFYPWGFYSERGFTKVTGGGFIRAEVFGYLPLWVLIRLRFSQSYPWPFYSPQGFNLAGKSTKEPFVRFDPVDSTICGDNWRVSNGRI